jgi:hypothetical protein
VNRRQFVLTMASLPLLVRAPGTMASDIPMQSRGLGLTYGELEREFGRPYVAPDRGIREFMGVTSENRLLDSLVLPSPPRTSDEIPHELILTVFMPAPRTTVEPEVTGFYPGDARLLDTYVTAEGDAVGHFASVSLRDRMADQPGADHPRVVWPNASPGEFIVVYYAQGGSLNPERIGAVGVALGNEPAAIDR